MRGRAVALASALGIIAAFRAWSLRWGTSGAEVNMVLPGDELMPRIALGATRAVTVQAPPEAVWPWIAQLGQGRAGFYSYDILENLVGCDIHSANRLMPEWQAIVVGDDFRLAPEMRLAVASVERNRSLVLRGGIPLGNAAALYDFTWAFVLRDRPDGTSRLLVRERYTRPWARLLVEPTEVLSFVMSQKMLRGIKRRAERVAPPSASSPASTYAAAGLDRFTAAETLLRAS